MRAIVVSLLVASGAAAGCGGDRPAGRQGQADEAAVKPVAREEPRARGEGREDAGDRGSDAGKTAGDEEIIERLSRAEVVGARPVSSRSLSLKLFLEGGGSAVFKPVLKGKSTASSEVAYYLLATHLGVAGAPPSTMRKIPLARLAGLLERRHPEEAAALRERARTDDRGAVQGAAIAWVPGLTPSGLDGPGGRQRLEALLAEDGPSRADEPLAAAASSMVLLDYVAGNWDRYSGGNLFLDPATGSLALIDNDAAFSRLSERQHQRMESLLAIARRFPAGLVERLRSLDRDGIDRALSRDPWHREAGLLGEDQVRRLLERRDAALARVDALAARVF